MSEEKETLEQTEGQQDHANPEENKQAEEATETGPAEASPHVDLASEVERYKALAEESEARMLRALADMENMRRRVRKEQEDLIKYSSQKLIENLLPVVDNFERALSADRENMTVESLLEGVDMVYRQLKQVFEQEGLTAIEAVGKPFDPHYHQAVMTVDDPDTESGIVVEELQKGYQYKDRVIRPSMVKVNN